MQTMQTVQTVLVLLGIYKLGELVWWATRLQDRIQAQHHADTHLTQATVDRYRDAGVL